MKHIFIAIMAYIALVVTCYGRTSSSQRLYINTIDGIPDTIKISNDTLLYIADTSQGPKQRIDTLARCKMEHVADNFYEINSTEFDEEKIFRNMKIEQLQTGIAKRNSILPGLKDKILIIFDLPQFNNGINTNGIEVAFDIEEDFDDNVDDRYYPYKNDAAVTVQPGFRDEFHFRIKCVSRGFNAFLSGSDNGRSFSINNIRCPYKINVDSNADAVRITIPNLSPFIFKYLYIENEYIYISDSKIQWRGNTYIRKP